MKPTTSTTKTVEKDPFQPNQKTTSNHIQKNIKTKPKPPKYKTTIIHQATEPTAPPTRPTSNVFRFSLKSSMLPLFPLHWKPHPKATRRRVASSIRSMGVRRAELPTGLGLVAPNNFANCLRLQRTTTAFVTALAFLCFLSASEGLERTGT